MQYKLPLSKELSSFVFALSVLLIITRFAVSRFAIKIYFF